MAGGQTHAASGDGRKYPQQRKRGKGPAANQEHQGSKPGSGTQQQQHPISGHSRERSGSSKSHGNHEKGVKTRPPYQPYPLNFTTLKKLKEDSTENSEIVKKLLEEECGLKKLLQENSDKSDIIELVLVVIGKFCKKNGAASFSTAFPKIMQILAEKVLVFIFIFAPL